MGAKKDRVRVINNRSRFYNEWGTVERVEPGDLRNPVTGEGYNDMLAVRLDCGLWLRNSEVNFEAVGRSAEERRSNVRAI